LRSPGYTDIDAARVYGDGFVFDYGNYVNIEYGGVRPAFFLNLGS
jgi:hypothetical protein